MWVAGTSSGAGASKIEVDDGMSGSPLPILEASDNGTIIIASGLPPVFELVLTFVLATSAPSEPRFAQRVVTYATPAQCQAARLWWMRNTDSQLPGMDERYRLLIGPSCRPAAGA